MTSPSEQTAPNPVVYGKYQLLELLARGGMAEVFKAKSHGVEGFEKVLVIKRILPELSRNPQFVDMFINEAKICVTLSHANIVQVFDLGKAEETYFIAMEYVAGYDLATVLARARSYKRPLPAELAVYVASEVAKALDYAHRRRDSYLRPLNIVHRDVSPQNVLLSFEGEVKLTDFGIAKARTIVEDETQMGVLKGKYAYMAPEQANGREVDARTDLFALGTVLYEALSGKNPFAAESTYDTLQNVRRGEATPLHQLGGETPDELSHIVALAMSPGIESRHPNAGRLYEDLIQFLYSSGRRVGAHDLARYLEELREASERDAWDEGTSKLERDFAADGTPSARHRGAAATPAEVPSSKPSSQSKRTTGTGEKVATGVRRPRAERRDVTILATLASRIDLTPENTMRALIARFGGQVIEQTTAADGRWMVVAFGVSDPDGRDTEAAARCGLRIARAASATQAGLEPSMRLGLTAGRVLVDLSGDILRDERYDGLLAEARQLAGRARTGALMATPATERLLSRRFNLDRDSSTGDGALRITGERSVAEASGRFVGRRNELRSIGEVLALSNRGQRRVLALVGEAGVGKTRLIVETIRRLRLGGHEVGVYVATVNRQGRDVPLASFQEMLRVILGIDELDPEPLIRDKIGRLRELGLTQSELRAVEITLGVQRDEEGGEVGNRPLRSAFTRIATRLAADRLTVFVFDGAEWMDDESQVLVDSLLRDTALARLLVSFAFRPGFVHAWTDLPGFSEVQVGALSDDEVVTLSADRLGAEEVPLPLLREVTAKSGGNPLYVEEYLNALRDAGAVELASGAVVYRPEVAEVEVPKTLRGIVAARMARLGPVQRHLLQVASVVGPRFASDVLAKVAGEDVSTVARALAVLESRGIVVRQGSSEYGFAHELGGEVLRESLTLEAKRELHGAVAAALEALYPQRVDELAERLADHFREAGEREKALDYLVRAADRLEAEHVLDGASAALGRAIELLRQAPSPDRDRLLGLYRRIGELAFRSRDLERGADRMMTAIELAEGLGREDYVARFCMLRGRLLANANRFHEGRQWLNRAREVARRIGVRDLLRDVVLGAAEAFTKNGEYSSAIGLLREALSLSRDTGDLNAQIRCLIPLSLAYAATGDQRTSLETLDEARKLAGLETDRFTDCEILKTESLIHYYAKNWDVAIDLSSRGLELSKEYGFWYEAAVNAHNMGEGHLRVGDYKRAFAQLRYSYELSREHGFTKIEYNNLRVLGFIDAVRFRSPEGRERIAQAMRHAEENAYVWDQIQSRYLLALADYALGRIDDARRGLRETMRLSAEHGDTRYHDDAVQTLRAIDEGQEVKLPA
jgi:serine/threonine protein kinase/tetratricopeptide (TPR) repeat protein